jgi:hypothetical protein
MSRLVRKYLYFIFAGIMYLIIHEGVHIVLAKIFGIYEGIRILPLGIEVKITQPLTIGGVKLAAFSGLSSIVTILIGYILLILSRRILKLNNQMVKNCAYYVIFIFILTDPLYISLLSFLVGGDINGIVLGLNIPYMVVRGIFFVTASFNTYLVYKKLYPMYVIQNN